MDRVGDRAKAYTDWLIGAGLTALALALYGGSLRYPFFWDDPEDLMMMAQAHSVVTLVTTRVCPYYRPLAFVLWKTLHALQGRFDPLTFHLLHVLTHALNGVLTYKLARRLIGQRIVATAAAVLFVLYPHSYQAVTWVTTNQPGITALLLGALIAYYDGRVRGSRWLLWISLTLMAIALPWHENATSFGIIVAALELVILRRGLSADSGVRDGAFLKRAARWWPFPVIHLLICTVFFVLWLNTSTDASSTRWRFETDVGWYLLQGFIWPVAGAVGPWRAWLSGPAWRPLTIVVPITLAWLFLAYWRGRRLSLLGLSVLWFVVTVLPAWATLGIGYVGIAPRLFYASAPGVALVWAGLLGLPIHLPRVEPRWGSLGWKIGVGTLVAVMAWQSIAFVAVRNRVYGQVMPAVWDVVRHGEEAGAEAALLFINAPDRVTPVHREYPVGRFLVMVMPISVDLGDYAALHTGVRPTTGSLSVPALAGLDRYPHQVNMRGIIAEPDTLMEAIRAADAVFLTEYHPGGTVRVVEAGGVFASPDPPRRLATFGDVVQLQEAVLEASNRLVLHWICLGPGAPNDTIFVHITGEDGHPVAQADGDPLHGLWPLEVCQRGEHIHDVRNLSLEDIPAGEYAIRVGAYNRVTGSRLPARDADGEPIPDGGLVVAVVGE